MQVKLLSLDTTMLACDTASVGLESVFCNIARSASRSLCSATVCWSSKDLRLWNVYISSTAAERSSLKCLSWGTKFVRGNTNGTPSWKRIKSFWRKVWTIYCWTTSQRTLNMVKWNPLLEVFGTFMRKVMRSVIDGDPNSLSCNKSKYRVVHNWVISSWKILTNFDSLSYKYF